MSPGGLTEGDVERVMGELGGTIARRVGFKPLEVGEEPKDPPLGMQWLWDVPVQVSVQLGGTFLTVREVLALEAGSLLELDRLAGEPLAIMVNGVTVAFGEVVVINEVLGVRVNSIDRGQSE